MKALSTVKLLAGAIALRTVEVYKLLVTKFSWLLLLCAGLLLIGNHSTVLLRDFSVLLIFISTVILLSRSSLVRKDWRYVFCSDKTVMITVWNIVFFSVLFLFFNIMPYSPAVIQQYIIGLVATILVLWAFCLLDYCRFWKQIPYSIIASIYQVGWLLWNNPLMFLFLPFFTTSSLWISQMTLRLPQVFFLNWSLHFWIVFNKLWSLLIPLIIAPWYITTMAVLYEEMRYRAGV